MAKVFAARQHRGDGSEAYGMIAMRIMGKFDAGPRKARGVAGARPSNGKLVQDTKAPSPLSHWVPGRPIGLNETAIALREYSGSNGRNFLDRSVV